MLGAHFAWRPWGELYESVCTAESAFKRIYGEPFFQYLHKHPDDARTFHAAMTSGSSGRLPAVLAAYDFSIFERLVDVGGGHGALLHGILSASPKTRGVLYDLPSVVAGAGMLQSGHVAARCEVVGGDFFDSVPPDADGYVLSHIIHDWSDEDALRILRNCRRAIRPDGKLLLIEGVLKPPNEPDPLKFLDVWFIGGGGQERTEADFRALLRDGGFLLTRVIPTVGSNAILEGQPMQDSRERGAR
jgi:SAM-dependent methyltransferase